MEQLIFDLSREGKAFKILNATNGGPWHSRHKKTLLRSNFESYKAARIPFSRNHDSAVHGIYGGYHSHDMTGIFPNEDADPFDPESYDFINTDEAILTCLEAGTETFFRLGQSACTTFKTHWRNRPKDFHHWALVSEHIIRHYNEGWANGYRLNIRYWEIWNEPDLHPEYPPERRFWGGTKEEFFDFFATVAKHLKKCFPDIKIGGPSVASSTDWTEEFLGEMRKRNVPLDFFSWHCYAKTPEKIMDKANRYHALLCKYGYQNTESILNEWNYVKGWTDEFQYSVNMIHGLKGSAFLMSCICLAQQSPIDMLMYYDTRPSIFCGVFDFYSYQPLKGYYPMYWYSMFYDMEKEIPSENTVDDLYSLCGVDKNGKVLALVTYFSDDDRAPNRRVSLDFGRPGQYDIYLLDGEHDGQLVGTTDRPEFELPVHATVLIREKETDHPAG